MRYVVIVKKEMCAFVKNQEVIVLLWEEIQIKKLPFGDCRYKFNT